MKRFLVALFLAAATMVSAPAAACPHLATFTGRSSATDNPPVIDTTSYSVNGTRDVYFFLDVLWITSGWGGSHQWYVEVDDPSGNLYQNLPNTTGVTISPSGGTTITCGKEFDLGTPLLVAGTVIQSSGLYGTWHAKMIVDGTVVSTYAFTLTNP